MSAKDQIKNPVINEDISISKQAAKRLQAVMKSENKSDHALRMSVIGGGCSGRI